MATRPDRVPLHRKLGSGLPNRSHMYDTDASAPAAEDRSVLTAIRATFGSAAERTLPLLKPNQPKAIRSVPSMYIGTLCAGSGLGRPSARNLPSRGPSAQAPTSAVTPP